MGDYNGNVCSLALISETDASNGADALEHHFGVVQKHCETHGLKTLLVHRSTKVLHFFEGTQEQIQNISSLISKDLNAGVIASQNYDPSPSILEDCSFQIMNANREGFDGEITLERFLQTPNPHTLLNTEAIRLRRLFFRLKSEASLQKSVMEPMCMN
ncbi:MAG: hypothetical protein LW629_09235 [Burkholderiales bacterium]|nr:hypothetical protein [Burkholderiales bacterium]